MHLHMSTHRPARPGTGRVCACTGLSIVAVISALLVCIGAWAGSYYIQGQLDKGVSVTSFNMILQTTNFCLYTFIES